MGVHICFFGHQIHFSHQYCYALKLERMYQLKAEIAAKRFKQIYDSYGSFEKFAASCLEDGVSIILKYIEDTVQELVRCGIYDIDARLLAEQNGPFIFASWMEINEQIDRLLEQIETNIGDAKRLRELRKAARGRVVGGGFGVRGATKGILLAGSMNAASGLLHSGINAIGNSITRSNYRKQLNQIYKSDDMSNLMCMAIYTCIMSLCDVAKSYQGISIVAATQESKEEARAIRSNLNKIPKIRRSEQAAELLSISAWDIETYKALLKLYGDPDGTLLGTAKIAGLEKAYRTERRNAFEVRLTPIRSGIRAKAVASIRNVNDNQRAEVAKQIQGIKSEILQIARAFGMTGKDLEVEEYIREVDQIFNKREIEIENLDKQQRTVDGTLYETIELARKAKSNRAEAKRLISALEEAEYSKIRTIFEQIQKLNKEEPAGSIEDILQNACQIYEQVDVSARTVAGVTYETIELAGSARSHREEADCLVSSCERKSYQELIPIISQLQKLDQTVPKGSVSDRLQSVIQIYNTMEKTARTFGDSVLSSHEEYQKVVHDYDYLIHSAFSEDQHITENDIAHARKMQDDTQFHPVAREKFSVYVNWQEEELRKQKAAIQESIKAKKRNIISFALDMVTLCVLLFEPILAINKEPMALIEIACGCIEFFGQTGDSPWIIFVLITAFSVPCLLGIAQTLIGYTPGGVSLIVIIHLALLLVFAALSSSISCTVLFYILFGAQIFLINVWSGIDSNSAGSNN